MFTTFINITNGILKFLSYLFYGIIVNYNNQGNRQMEKKKKMKKQLKDYLSYMNKKI